MNLLAVVTPKPPTRLSGANVAAAGLHGNGQFCARRRQRTYASLFGSTLRIGRRTVGQWTTGKTTTTKYEQMSGWVTTVGLGICSDGESVRWMGTARWPKDLRVGSGGRAVGRVVMPETLSYR